MKKRMYELAKTRRGLKKEKAHKRSVYGLSGVPGATRTPGLPLRSCKDCFPFRHGISLSIPKNACIWAFVDVLHPTLSHVVPRKNPRP